MNVNLPSVRTSEIRTPSSATTDKTIINSQPTSSTSSMFYSGLAPLDIKSRVATSSQGSPATLSSSAAASTATQFPSAITASTPSMSASPIVTSAQVSAPSATAAPINLKRTREDFAQYPSTTVPSTDKSSFMLNQMSGDSTPAVKQHKQGNIAFLK